MEYLFIKSTEQSDGQGNLLGSTEIGVNYDPKTLEVIESVVRVSGKYPKPIVSGTATKLSADLSSKVRADNTEQEIITPIGGVYLEESKEFGLSLPYKLDIKWQ